MHEINGKYRIVRRIQCFLQMKGVGGGGTITPHVWHIPLIHTDASVFFLINRFSLDLYFSYLF